MRPGVTHGMLIAYNPQIEQPSGLLLAWSTTNSHAGLDNALQQCIWPGQLACMWALPSHISLWVAFFYHRHLTLWLQLACVQ